MNFPNNKPQIWSIDKLLKEEIIIPDYQRPYKWNNKNITDLILDTKNSIEESLKYKNFKYRVGTIIFYKNENNKYEIVDGQQRLLSFLLLKLYLQPDFDSKLLETKFSNKTTQKNLHDNYITIKEWFSSDENDKEIFNNALKDILEVVVITVNKIEEAFQLFDSQNSRGRALYPHDLLKAYHLREINDKYDMQNAVVKWEAKDPKEIRKLFDLYLYPIWNWSKCKKCDNFISANIDIYKGIDESSGYTYARRANKAMPYFLLSEPFISGYDFFEMVDHYMLMLHNIKEEIITNPNFNQIKEILTCSYSINSNNESVNSVEDLDRIYKSSSIGLNYARNLFFCALLCYYDRFHNFDTLAVKKLFTWAMMVRVDMQYLGFDTINRYAIGLDNDKYSNTIPVISMITIARRHTEISSMKLKIRDDNKTANKNYQNLYEELCKLNSFN